tara:strand:- start:402 stop:686 length:285 start_codon:yes stop_codon:yes gene_type:complete
MKDYTSIITGCLKESHSSYQEMKVVADTEIFGGNSKLDSLGLVTFLVSLEQKIEDAYGIQITIADEKAMSLTNSPFRTVGSLNDYLSRLIIKDE